MAQLIVTVNHPQMRPNFNYTSVHQRYVHLCLFSLPLVKSLNNDICIRTASTLSIMMDKHQLMFITLNNYFRNDSRRITVITTFRQMQKNGLHQMVVDNFFSSSADDQINLFSFKYFEVQEFEINYSVDTE